MQDKVIGDSLAFKDYVEYAGFIVIAGLMRVLPVTVGVVVGKYIAMLFCLITGRSSTYIKYQMRECFGDQYTPEEYDKLAKKFYRHCGCFLVEAVRLKMVTKDNIDDIVDWGGIVETIADLTEETGKGVFLATGHIGNWEFTGFASALKGFLLGSIARPQNNPLIDRKVKEYREYSGQKIWDKEGAIIKLLQAIKRKKSVGVLIDQDGGEQGVKSQFLNRPASTNQAVSEMAMRLGAAILPCAIIRDGDKPLKFKVVMGAPVLTDKNKKTLEEVYRVTTEIDNELSGIISKYPQQWLWIHKRWKTPNPMDVRWYKRYE